MSEKLTPQQKLAIENRGGNLLVSAAAGSGKTKVLVDRLMSYLLDPISPANLDDFLIITYTKAAAAELRGKISDKLTKHIAEHPENRHLHQQIQRLHLAKISTVHGFCADILREYAYRLDISADFRIAEENECQEIMYGILETLLDEMYSEKLNEESFRAFIDTQGLGRDDRQIPEIILQIYTSALCHLDPEGWLSWCQDSAMVDPLSDAGSTVWGAYLISDLQEYLSEQIESFTNCIEAASDIKGLEKPVTLLRTTLADLHTLHACDTWDAIVNHPPVEFGSLRFNKEHNGTQLAERIKAIRNHCKDGLAKKLKAFAEPSAVVLSHLQQALLSSEGLVQLVKEFKSRYDKAKRSRRVLDFSDIEQKTLDLLWGKHRSAITTTAEEIGSRFREIMVDEYQDSNEVQDAIFAALTQERKNCFMVGDVKQSIYQFRLADPSIFLNKYHSFAPAESALPGEGRKVLLSSNFRSSGSVISAANDVFQQTMSPKVGGLYYGESEMLREGIPHIPLNDKEVELYCIDVTEDTYAEEATVVANRIHSLLDGKHMVRQGDELRPIVADDIAILLRSPGSVGGEFQYALECAGIACSMGNDADLLQAPEVESLRSILQIIHNPLQDIPLIAALTSPVIGFTADELAQIRVKNKYLCFYEAMKQSNSEKAAIFMDFLAALRHEARFLTVSQLIHRIFTVTGMLSIYGTMPEGDTKVRRLQSFCQVATEYEATGRKDLSSFLDRLNALDEKGLSITGATPSGAVRIMSIHKSKGLEFPVVFLCGLSRHFNMTDSQKHILCHKDLGFGLSYTNVSQRVRFPTIAKRAISAKISRESISEELRVLYVAMTRAKDRLIMTYAAPKLENDLLDLANRMDMSSRDLITAHAYCPGTWVLLTALQRTEAGALFQIADRPECVQVQNRPWHIRVVRARESESILANNEESLTEIDPQIVDKMRKGLQYSYPYTPVTSIPSKLTATQLKGRVKDMEAAEFASGKLSRAYDFRPMRQKCGELTGTEYGNAIHSVMQYLDFSMCDSENSIRKDLSRILEDGLITQQQANAVNVTKISEFFQTSIGQRLLKCREVLREFKFSIMENADKYFGQVCDEQILLQGVIDCAMVQEDGIIVLDFKTDFITQDNFEDKLIQYCMQINTYANALSRIYERPVTEKYIYFFSSGQLIPVE